MVERVCLFDEEIYHPTKGSVTGLKKLSNTKEDLSNFRG
jgi:hypothetical protein